jgi:hypothetical protein
VGKKFTVRQCKKRTAKFVFAVRQEKTHGKVCVCRAPMQKRTANILLAVRFFRRVSLEKHTAKQLFALRPKKYARQTFRRTANMEFPVVMAAHQQQIAYNHVAC